MHSGSAFIRGVGLILFGCFLTLAQNTAQFVRNDSLTQGSWKGVYGADGYNIVDNATFYPSYVTVTPSGQSDYIWADSTSEARGLQKIGTTDRILSTWDSSDTFTIDMNF